MTSILIVDSRGNDAIDITISLPEATPAVNCFNVGRNLRRGASPITDTTSHDQMRGWWYQDEFQLGQEDYFLGNEMQANHPQAYIDGFNYTTRCHRSNIAEMLAHEASDQMDQEPGYYESTRPWMY